ncbi:MAG: toll/interleukin-1 receptor domain-containing protein [Cyanobacteria bacterium J06597_1]
MSDIDVFLSHSARDKKWVREFAKALETHKLTVWLDEWTLKPGMPWQDALEKALRDSETIVSVMDVESESDWSSWALYEIGLAVGMNKRIVLVLPPNAPLDKLPISIRETAVLRRESPEEVAREFTQLQARI